MAVTKAKAKKKPKGESCRGYVFALLLENNKARLSDEALRKKVLARFPDSKTFTKPSGIARYRQRLNTGKRLAAGITKPKTPILRYDAKGKPITRKPKAEAKAKKKVIKRKRDKK